LGPWIISHILLTLSNPTLLGGSSYFITFINDYTKETLVYFIKNKLDVFETFKILKLFIENEIGLKLKFLKSNNGG